MNYEFCKKKINFFRGSLNNVINRVYKLAITQKAYGSELMATVH